MLLIWLLLDAGAGDSLIKSTVLGSHRDVVGMPIDRMANIRHLDGSGRTLIRAAVGRLRNAALVRLLADSGANLSEADSDGCNLLHVAIRGPPEIIKILLEFGKSIGLHRRDSKRRASLLSCRGLGVKGARMSRHLDQADMDRWPPLCWVVRQCKRDLAEDMGSKRGTMLASSGFRILLRHGENRTATSRLGGAAEMTPLTLAWRCGTYEEIVDMLEYGIEREPCLRLQRAMMCRSGDTTYRL